MMMYRIVRLVVFGTAALFMGCDNGTAVSPGLTEDEPSIQEAEGIAAAKGVKYVPFMGNFTQTILTQTPEADEVDFGVECDPFPWIEIVDRWEGTATHLGTFTGLANGCTHVFTGEITGVIGRFYAANGDQLNLTLEGQILGPFEPGEKIRWEFTVVPGGTGRFSNATTPPGEPIVGEATIPASVVSGPPVVFEAFEATGRISSVGSSK